MIEDKESILAELLCSRLCHDLAGSVGAVGTGAELLADEDVGAGLADEALSLLTSSATTAVSRLRYLRLALGSGGADMTSRQLRDLAGAMLAPAPGSAAEYRFAWLDTAPLTWEAGLAKLLLNLVLLARDFLPRGGSITVGSRDGEGARLRVSAEGAVTAHPDLLAALIATDANTLTPRGAQGYYSVRVAARLGLALRLDRSAQAALLVAVQQ